MKRTGNNQGAGKESIPGKLRDPMVYIACIGAAGMGLATAGYVRSHQSESAGSSFIYFHEDDPTPDDETVTKKVCAATTKILDWESYADTVKANIQEQCYAASDALVAEAGSAKELDGSTVAVTLEWRSNILALSGEPRYPAITTQILR